MELSKFITDKDVDDTIKILSENSVIGQVSKTGSGKSTIFVPKLNQKTSAIIYSVQQTVPAVNEISSRVKQILGDDNVGSAAESIVKYKNQFLKDLRTRAKDNLKKKVIKKIADSNKTKVVFVTSKHMEKIFIDLVEYTKKFGTDGTDLSFCDILIIDEAHRGVAENEIVMALWKSLFNSGAILPRLILTSADLDMKLTQFPDAPCQYIKTKQYPVKILYHNKDYSVNSNELYEDTVDVIIKNSKEDNSYKRDENGSTWLVFCPGSNEVEKVASLLRAKGPGDLLIVPFYSEMDSVEMEKVFNKCLPFIRKIIISTNIAETALTIDNCSYVFDTMTEKMTNTSMSGGLRLDLVNISKASANQRMGRTGRTCPGKNYRMCTEFFFNSLEEQKSSEIDRNPIFNTIIKILNLELNPLSLFPNLNKDKVKNAIKLLNNLNMIEKYKYEENTLYKVTEEGNFASKFSFSVKNSSVLFEWIKSGLPIFPGLVTICILDSYSQGYFYYPKKDNSETKDDYIARMEAYYEKHFSKFYHHSDLGILLNLFKSFIEEYKSYDVDYKKIVEFSVKNSLNNRKFSDFLINLKQSIKILENDGHKIKFGSFNVDKLLDKLQPFFLKTFSDDILELQGSIYKKDGIEYFFDKKPGLKIEQYRHKKIISLLNYEVNSGKKTRKFIVLSIPKKYVYYNEDEEKYY